MNINKVNYQRTFNLGNYCSERIGVELDLNPGEDATTALDTARKLVEEYHQKGSPPLNFDNTPDIPIIPKKEEGKPIMTREDAEQELMYGKNIPAQIQSCTELKTLESYKFIVKGKPELETIYQNKLKELQ